MFPKRTGLIVWVNDARLAKNLERFGNVLYISKRLSYVVIYVNELDIEKKLAYIKKLNFVKKVEKSYRTELKTDFSTQKLI